MDTQENYRLKLVKERAAARARQSSNPGEFMTCFMSGLNSFRRGADVSEGMRRIWDATREAAEIEALAAGRAISRLTILAEEFGEE
jgi:hypothetical protein